MKAVRLPFGFVFALMSAVALTQSGPAFATAQRTFVASNGNDVGPCSIAQPCRSFAAALAQTNPGGEVIVLDSAGYGPVAVNKSVSIVAPAGIYAGISVFTGNGVSVNAPGSTVVLRGLSINGQGGAIGVDVQNVTRMRIENCVISSMTSNGILHAANTELAVLDTIVRDNGGTGIRIAADASVVLDHVRSEHNGLNGFYIAPVASAATASITDSVFAFNGSNGVWADALAGNLAVAIDRSVLADNLADGIRANASPGGVELNVMRNVIQHNAFEGVEVLGQAPSTYAIAAVSDNAFSRNADHAIRCAGTFNALVFAARNSMPLLDQTAGFLQAGSCFFGTYSNNTGTASTSGTITSSVGF